MTRLAAAAAVLALAYAAHRWATTHPDDVDKAAARIAAQAGVSWDDAAPNVREVLRGHARAALGRRG